jgi:ubiquinol-cytochrome c reductase cytochrome b subunit
MSTRIPRAVEWFDDRLHVTRFVRSSLDKIFPDHWSFLLGEIALYSFVVLLVTGIYLTFFFVPSLKDVVYTGPYQPLHGLRVSEAYQSVLHISFEVRAGLVMRQMHHWAAVVFVGAIVVHLARVFFTGAFRRPRELNWVVGVTLLVLAIANGFAGYSLPDDLLSGTGLRVMYSVLESVPVIGTWLAFLVFGGKYEADSIITRLYVVHILLIPAAIIVLLAAHLAIMWHQKHTQFAGRGRTEDNVVGVPLWPTFAARSTGFMFMIAGALAALGGLAQINPVWLYGPYVPSQVSAASQPDWYLGWLDGALRIMPNFELHLGGYTVANLFFPAILLPGITFGLIYAWPWLEAWRAKDRRPHHLCQRPRDAPARTALGVAAIAFYASLFVAAGTDVIAVTIGASENSIIWALRLLCIVLPVVTGVVAYRLCKELAAAPSAGSRPRPSAVSWERGQGYVAIEEHAGELAHEEPEIEAIEG